MSVPYRLALYHYAVAELTLKPTLNSQNSRPCKGVFKPETSASCGRSESLLTASLGMRLYGCVGNQSADACSMLIWKHADPVSAWASHLCADMLVLLYCCAKREWHEFWKARALASEAFKSRSCSISTYQSVLLHL